MPTSFQENAEDYIIYHTSSDGLFEYMEILFWSGFEKILRNRVKKSWIWITVIDAGGFQMDTIGREVVQIMNLLKAVD